MNAKVDDAVPKQSTSAIVSLLMRQISLQTTLTGAHLSLHSVPMRLIDFPQVEIPCLWYKLVNVRAGDTWPSSIARPLRGRAQVEDFLNIVTAGEARL
jgi:hypothetical protein